MFMLLCSVSAHFNSSEPNAAQLCHNETRVIGMTDHSAAVFTGHAYCSVLPRWRGVFPRLSRWLGSAP